ncbi:hypothetical protein C7B82_24390 [Stenomitos frigidus ULC18]|uniref:Uncharacterized protein n=1 Tax=Stenomitos frigidus ULC18 TaxID=2107698 RepID=A0A2T1DXF4_9CYAN|nr:hypothetical protein C7B82_24390 [Stenomitos frigidus ULC18]
MRTFPIIGAVRLITLTLPRNRYEVISEWLSAISYQLSAVSYQRSAFNLLSKNMKCVPTSFLLSDDRSL